jgi:uncharacterized protein (TIGR02246 family)
MHPQLLWYLALPLVIAGYSKGPAFALEPKGDPKDIAALGKSAEAFVEAFHKGDAKALAALWTADGDYTDQTGRSLSGREAIAKNFEGFFAENKGLKLRIDSDSLRFVTADVAIEDGVTSVITPDGAPPSRARFTIVHVKKEGQWLLSSVRDASYAPPGNAENFKGLEWAIGDWVAENDKGDSEHLLLSWTSNQNFILATFTAKVKGISVGSVTHWIGWDPLAKNVRSWLFDTTGGFGEGAWTKDGDKWTVKTTSVLQDGKKAAATVVIARVDENTISLQSKDRTVDGKAVPDSAVVKLKRNK